MINKVLTFSVDFQTRHNPLPRQTSNPAEIIFIHYSVLIVANAYSCPAVTCEIESVGLSGKFVKVEFCLSSRYYILTHIHTDIHQKNPWACHKHCIPEW